MHPLTHTTLVGNWATLLLATNKNGEIDYKRMGESIRMGQQESFILKMKKNL